MAKLLTVNESLEVKKSDVVVRARYKLNPLSLKFITTLIAGLKRSDDVNEEYVFRVKDFQELTNLKRKDLYWAVKQALKELLEKPFYIPNEDGFMMCNWVSGGRYIESAGEIHFMIYPKLRPYLLEAKEKFLKYRLENILPLKSGYSIRLYEILKDWYGLAKRYDNKTEKVISLQELREILEIPRSYNYGMFKKRVLHHSQKEIQENTDISFTFEEIREGRRVTHIKFKIEKIKEQNEDIYAKEQVENIVQPESKKDQFAFKKLLKLKERVLNGELSFLRFKKELMDIPNTEICNSVDRYLDHLILRTNEFGYLEFYDNEEDRVIEIDNKDVIDIKKWLFKNPYRIGDFKEFKRDLLHPFRDDLVGKYITGIDAKKRRYILKIEDLELMEQDRVRVKAYLVLADKKVELEVPMKKLDEWKEIRYEEYMLDQEIERVRKLNQKIEENEKIEEFRKRLQEDIDFKKDFDLYLNDELEKVFNELEEAKEKGNRVDIQIKEERYKKLEDVVLNETFVENIDYLRGKILSFLNLKQREL